jgi:multiple sugar transport system permease protein
MTQLTEREARREIRRRIRQSRSAKKIIKTTLHYLMLTLVTGIFFSPIAYMLIGSLKPTAEVLDGINGFALKHLSFNNYLTVFSTFNDDSMGYLWRFYSNSILVSFVIVFGGLIVNSMIAYALARLRWRGRNAVQVLVVLLVIMPFEAIAIPLFYLLRDYRNTYFVQFLPFIASAFSIYLFYTFFIGLPLEIQESARLDGAGPWRVYRAIILPMSKPVFASVTILSFLGAWSSFLFPLMMVDNPDYVPLPLEIQVYFTQPPTDWGPIFAFGVILILPVLAVFLLFQRWFIQSVASSAVKG